MGEEEQIVGQDKPTVELSMVLDVALSGCHNLDSTTIWPVHHFDVGGQISPPYSVYEASYFFDAVKLASYFYFSVIVAWSIESRKQQNGHSGVEVGFQSNQTPSYYDTVLYNNYRLL